MGWDEMGREKGYHVGRGEAARKSFHVLRNPTREIGRLVSNIDKCFSLTGYLKDVLCVRGSLLMPLVASCATLISAT